ncbi:MAG TPA: SDR family NAD(P)-dependent oxidoreductase, partial [Prosthecobacter sp.]|nr:SDR family NAD(P)-dependent oxidoreductase [Prosthecobacter sp.]
LEAVRADLVAKHPRLQVEIVAADVATDAGRARVVAAAQRGGVNLLINNAGLGDYGTLASAPEERLRAQIDLNISAVVLLTHGVLPHLKRSDAMPAGIVNVSSLAGTVPMPALAVYAASKAFVTSFSEALNVELGGEKVIVTCVCPGPTPTNFSKTARRPDGADTDREGQGALRILPAQVVAEGLAALRDGRACVFPGTGVKVAGTLFRLMPRPVMRWALRRRYRKGEV